MQRLILKTTGMFLFVIAVLLLLGLNGALFWVATGPRDLSDAIPYIEEALNEENSEYHVKIHHGMLMWDGWRNPVDIRLKDVDMLTREDVRFASFPDVSLGVDIFALMRGQIVPNSIRVRNPVISLYQAEDGNITLGGPQDKPLAETGVENPPVHEQTVEEIVSAVKHPTTLDDLLLGKAVGKAINDFFSQNVDSLFTRMRRVSITNASVSLGNRSSGRLFELEKANLFLKRSKRLSSMRVEGYLQQKAAKKPPALVIFELEQNRHHPDQVIVRFRGSNVWLNAFQDTEILPKSLVGVNAPLSGTTEAFIDKDGEIIKVDFSLYGRSGTLKTEFLEEELAIKSFAVEGRMTPKKELWVDKASIDFGEYEAGAVAHIVKPKKGMGITMAAKAINIPASELNKLWPSSFAPESRAWIVKNITTGTVPVATVKVHIKPGDFKKDTLSDEAIMAEIQVENASVKYLPEQPPVTAIDGMVYVSANSLKVKAERATAFSNTQMREGLLTIPDLTARNPYINIRFKANGPAKDVAIFLSNPPAQHAVRLHLDPTQLRGDVTGQIKLGFSYSVPRYADGTPHEDLGVDYNIQAQVKNITQPQFMHKFDIASASGTLEINNTRVNFKGDGAVNKVPTSAEVRYFFTPRDGKELWAKIKASLGGAQLKELGVDASEYVSGTIGMNATYEQGAKLDEARVELDLANSELIFDQLYYSKPRGTPASLRFHYIDDGNDRLQLNDIVYRSGNDRANGSIVTSHDMGTVYSAEIGQLSLNDNELAGSYQRLGENSYKIKLYGARLDASPWLKSEEGEASGFSFEQFPKVMLEMNLRTLLLRKGYPIHQATADMDCSGAVCRHAKIAGGINKQPFFFRIEPGIGSKRLLDVEAPDAGELLRTFDIYDEMSGGKLSLKGEYNDVLPTHPLNGELRIGPHRIENTPALAKILTLASLTGVVDLLNGKGVAFKKLRAPFTLENDIITLNNAKTYGNSIGLTADGTIAFPQQRLALKGTVVPSYSINSAAGKIPIIGDIVTGGGDGIIAARYSIEGDTDNPDVSVNPLSMLTPGFLRGIFDIFEAPPPSPKSAGDELPASTQPINTR